MGNLISEQLAIERCIYEYAHAIDRRDMDLLKRLLRGECKIYSKYFTMTGVQEIITGIGGLDAFVCTQHHVHNILLDIEGSRATAEVYCVANHIRESDEKRFKLDWGIRYLDQLIKVGGSWQFIERELLIDWEQEALIL